MKKNRLIALKWISNTWLGKWRMRVFDKRIRNICYASIDKMPVFNWWRMREGDLSMLYKTEHEIGKGHKYILSIIAGELYDQYLRRFGFGDELTKILTLERECIQLRCELVAKDKGINRTFLKIKEQEIERIKKSLPKGEEPHDLLEITTALESLLKISINVDECPVSKFYAYMKMAKKHAESVKNIR